jgi:hypothetical protein
VLGIGIAFDPMFDRADALCRAVPLLASRIGTIDFDQHRVIDIRTERSFDCFDEALPQYQTSGGPPRIKSYWGFAHRRGKWMIAKIYRRALNGIPFFIDNEAEAPVLIKER